MARGLLDDDPNYPGDLAELVCRGDTALAERPANFVQARKSTLSRSGICRHSGRQESSSASGSTISTT